MIKMRKTRDSVGVRGVLSFSDEEREEEELAPTEEPTKINIPRLRAEDYLSRSEYELAHQFGQPLNNIRSQKLATVNDLQAKPVLLSQLLLESRSNKRLSTGIKPLDQLLSGGLLSGGAEILELRGPSGVGKTQLCMTIARTFARVHKVPILYIDTCNQVHISRLQQIMCFGDEDDAEVVNYMKTISIVRTTTVASFLQLMADLLDKDELPFSFIILDSLAHLMLPLTGRKNPGGSAVADLVVTLLRQLVLKFKITVLLTAFGQRHEDGTMKSGLGFQWNYTAHHVLTLDYSPVIFGNIECTLQATASLAVPVGTKIVLQIKTSGMESY